MGERIVSTYRPVVGWRVHVGAVEVSHSIMVGVGIACGCGQVQSPTGHLMRHGRFRVGLGGIFSWKQKEPNHL